jgi:hypothetical protein
LSRATTATAYVRRGEVFVTVAIDRHDIVKVDSALPASSAGSAAGHLF